MRAFLVWLLVAGVGLGAPAFARSTTASPLLGSWSVDISRLPISPAARPKRVTITFSSAGAGKLAMDVDIIDASGAEIHSLGTATLDGSPVSVKDSPETDAAAMELPEPDVLVVGLSKGGTPASTRIYTAAPDGKTMTETVAYFGENSIPRMRTNYFTRVR